MKKLFFLGLLVLTSLPAIAQFQLELGVQGNQIIGEGVGTNKFSVGSGGVLVVGYHTDKYVYNLEINGSFFSNLVYNSTINVDNFNMAIEVRHLFETLNPDNLYFLVGGIGYNGMSFYNKSKDMLKMTNTYATLRMGIGMQQFFSEKWYLQGSFRPYIALGNDMGQIFGIQAAVCAGYKF